MELRYRSSASASAAAGNTSMRHSRGSPALLTSAQVPPEPPRAPQGAHSSCHSQEAAGSIPRELSRFQVLLPAQGRGGCTEMTSSRIFPFFQQDWHPPAHGPHETPALSWAGPRKPFLPSREKKEVGAALECCLEGAHGPCSVHVQLRVAAGTGSGSGQGGGNAASMSEVPNRAALGHGDHQSLGAQGKNQPKPRDLWPWCSQTDRMDQNNQKLLMLRDCPDHLRH